ncbi:metalloproteinase inhibitor 2-like isoform X2 [Ostrea edulis]|nr:metalloproteinase inhibitor 2-like isoform X2 [Ostrea edulis]XP_048738749.1 metalloproteinase inhibitor 2-like isoform X2 [Ostrea edulis]XP_048738750.1 metalloproteinase inhibitor 2-like isoform X2 [Ostrea edulis]
MIFVSVLFVLWTVITEVGTCTCFPTHLQNHFCRAQIILVATVKDSEEIFQNSIIKAPNTRNPEDPYARMPVEIKYKVRIHRFFKGRELLGHNAKRVKYIHTSASGAACGLQLNKGKTYILSARIQRQREIWSSMCDWVQNYKTLNRHQLKGVKFYYKRNCKCLVSWCQGSYCQGPGPRECEWIPQMYTDCFQEHGFCMINSMGICHWKKNRQLRKCLDTNKQMMPGDTREYYEIPRDGPHRPGESQSWRSSPNNDVYLLSRYRDIK